MLTDKGFSETQLGLQYQADGPWTIFLPERKGSTEAWFDAMKEICPDALADPVAGLYSETDIRKGPQITATSTQVTNDIIQGRKPVSAWAAAVKKWKSGGGDKIAEEFAAGARSLALTDHRKESLDIHQPVRFAAVGLDHAHIHGQIAGLIEAGAEFVAMATDDPSAAIAVQVRERYPDVPVVDYPDELIAPGRHRPDRDGRGPGPARADRRRRAARRARTWSPTSPAASASTSWRRSRRRSPRPAGSGR